MTQKEGFKQSDTLASALFASGIHNELVKAAAALQLGEFLAAFLDDIYLITTPERAKAAFNRTTETIQRKAGCEQT